jgi:hypothetical protein
LVDRFLNAHADAAFPRLDRSGAPARYVPLGTKGPGFRRGKVVSCCTDDTR